jgi:hypothetical protein
MEQFVGECCGGPQDKQHMAHWSDTKKFYRPMIGFTMNMENSPVDAIEIGEYRFGNGQWRWFEAAIPEF